mgnify:CR=1 FL=1
MIKDRIPLGRGPSRSSSNMILDINMAVPLGEKYMALYDTV